MRCVPGDKALVIGSPKHSGRLVEVLYIAPVGEIVRYPNNCGHFPVGPNHWVVESLGSPFDVSVGRYVGGRKTITRQGTSMYGVCPDSRLVPLRDLDDDAQTQNDVVIKIAGNTVFSEYDVDEMTRALRAAIERP